MARFDERGADVEGVGFVQHRLDQAFHRVLGRAEGSQSRHAEGAARAAEDQVAAAASGVVVRVGAFAEVGEGELDDVECTPEIGLELVPDLVVVLVFARTNHAVARTVRYDVHPAPMFQALLEDGVDGRANTDVAEEGK